MSAGTLTLTNNSALVSGAGTSFTTELAAGDFVVATVGGIPYTLPVKTIESNTALTLVSKFTGPTQSGAAWSAVPRVALNMVTAALVTQSAEALRGLNYDKQNWQQVFSGTGTITVRLPDGTSFSGPAWNSIASLVDKKADKTALDGYAKKGANNDITSLSGLTTSLSVAQGGSGSNTAAGARGNLSAATTQQLTEGSGGNWYANFSSSLDSGVKSHGDTVNTVSPWDAPSKYTVVNYLPSPANNVGTAIASSWGTDNEYYLNARNAGVSGYQGWKGWSRLWHSRNTTVDSNGFIKRASPVVKVFSDGQFETNEESEGCVVARLSAGEYLISGCTGLNADAAWGGVDGGFEIPVDRNKQPRIWLDYTVNADGTVLIKTYHRVHVSSPLFAQNRIGNTDEHGVFTETVTDGEPVDIPTDAFVSVRVQMPSDSIWNRSNDDAMAAMKNTELEIEKIQQDPQQ
ncbi:phage tail fiber protein [Citrobacter pasteurii]